MVSLPESAQPPWGAESWIYQDLLEMLAQTEHNTESQGVLLRGNNVAQVHHNTEDGKVYILDGWCRVPVLFEFCSQTSSCDEDRRPASDVMIKLQAYSFSVKHRQSATPEAVVAAEEWQQLDEATTWVVDGAVDVNNIETIRDKLKTCHLRETDGELNCREKSMVCEDNSNLSSLLHLLSPAELVETQAESGRGPTQELWRQPVAGLGDLLISDTQKLVLEKQTGTTSQSRDPFRASAVSLNNLIISVSQRLLLDKLADGKMEKFRSSDSLFSDPEPDVNCTSSTSSKEEGQMLQAEGSGNTCREVEAKISQEVIVSSDDDIYIFNPHGKAKSKIYLNEILTKMKAEVECQNEKSSETPISQDFGLISSSSSEQTQDSQEHQASVRSDDKSNSDLLGERGCCEWVDTASRLSSHQAGQVKLEVCTSGCDLDDGGVIKTVESRTEEVKGHRSILTARDPQTQRKLGELNQNTSIYLVGKEEKFLDCNCKVDVGVSPSSVVSLNNFTVLRDKKTLLSDRLEFHQAQPVSVTQVGLTPHTNNGGPLKTTSDNNATSAANSATSAANGATSAANGPIKNSITSSLYINSENTSTVDKTDSNSTGTMVESFSAPSNTALAHSVSPYNTGGCNTLLQKTSSYTSQSQCTTTCNERKDNSDISSFKPMECRFRPGRKNSPSPKRARLSRQKCRNQDCGRRPQTVEVRVFNPKDSSVAKIQVKGEALLSFPDPVDLRKPVRKSSSCGVETDTRLKTSSHTSRLSETEMSGRGAEGLTNSCHFSRHRNNQMESLSPRGHSRQERQSDSSSRADDSFQSSPEAPGMTGWPGAGTRLKHQWTSTLSVLHPRHQSEAATVDSSGGDSQGFKLSQWCGVNVPAGDEFCLESSFDSSPLDSHNDSLSTQSTCDGQSFESQGFTPQGSGLYNESQGSLQWTTLKASSLETMTNLDSQTERTELETGNMDGIHRVLHFVHYGETFKF